MSDDHRRSSTSVPGVQVTVLGAFDLLIAGRSVPLPQDGRRLLAYLALHGGPQPVHVPVSVAGPEAADAVDAAAPGVLLRGDTAAGAAVTLAGEVRVDLTEAIAAVRELENAGRYRPELLDLLRHDVLPGCPDEWAVIERERFRQIRLNALETLCRRLTDAERTDDAIEVGLVAVAADRRRESARRALIEAHLAQGNISDAVAVYDDYVELMRASAGPVPAPEKVGLFQPSPAWPVLHVRRSALPMIGTVPGRRHEAPARRRIVTGSGSSSRT